MKSKIFLSMLLAVTLSSLAVGGCNWMGRTAGKTRAAVENGVESMKQGYNDGYSEEKKK